MKPNPLLPVAIVFASLVPLHSAEDDRVTPKGTDVGQWIPTTTTWIVVDPAAAKSEGRNTCLAGVNRAKRAVSIYARHETPALWTLLKAVDDGLKEHADLAAYVVIHKSLSDERGYNRGHERFESTQRTARQQTFGRVVVSLSRDETDTSLLPANEALRIVYSDRRIVRLSRAFPAVDVAPDQVRQLLGEIVSLAKERP